MLTYTDDETLQSELSRKQSDEVEYLGIGVFGENDEVNTLTKKFGLFSLEKKNP